MEQMMMFWIIIGVIVGALSRFLVPASDRLGWLGTIVLGVAGSSLGGIIGSLISGRGQSGGLYFSSGWRDSATPRLAQAETGLTAKADSRSS